MDNSPPFQSLKCHVGPAFISPSGGKLLQMQSDFANQCGLIGKKNDTMCVCVHVTLYKLYTQCCVYMNCMYFFKLFSLCVRWCVDGFVVCTFVNASVSVCVWLCLCVCVF